MRIPQTYKGGIPSTAPRTAHPDSAFADSDSIDCEIYAPQRNSIRLACVYGGHRLPPFSSHGGIRRTWFVGMLISHTVFVGLMF